MRTAEQRTWTLRCTELGRPPTNNSHRRLHFHERAEIDALWKKAFMALAREAKVPHLDEVGVQAMPVYPNRKSLPDVDAVAPAVKAAVDGLVRAGVLDDDGPKHFACLSYVRPEIEPGVAGLVLRIREITVHPERRP